MQQTTIQLPAMKLAGISHRTSNTAEMNPATAKIGAAIQQYQTLLGKSGSKFPHKTYAVYTEYENDFTGEYTYFIGYEIPAASEVPAEFQVLTIPAQKYTKFTTGPGRMPQVCIDMWQKIWAMNPQKLGGERAYVADFEVYDERAADPQHTILDIMIGVK